MSILCSMVGASFTVAAAVTILRSKKGITAVGNAQVDTAQSQFSGASALFDGTGDYLAVTNIASGIIEDQTFEFWIRFANLPSSGGFRMVAGDGGGERYMGLLNDGGTYRWEVSFSSGQYVERFTASVATNTWYHVALTKSASTLRVYQGGTQLTSAVSFNTMSAEKTLFVSGTNYIGSWNTDSNFLNGWMDEIRVSNNVRYTANFTPSTTPFVNDANTVLLIHCNGTDASTFFEDDNGVRAHRGIIANGNAQVSTAQSKFGGSSALFDGASDYIVVTNPGDLTIDTGNVTIEGWVRPIAKTRGFPVIACNESASGWNAGSWLLTDRHNSYSTKFSFWINNFNSGAALLISTTSVVNNTWYHLAIVRNSNTWKMFINGTEEASATFSGSLDTSGRNITFGISGNLALDTSYHGYVDEFRISNTARYTANFTPSTTAFQDDANNVLLLHMDGVNGSTTFIDDSGGRGQKGIQAIGNAQLSTAQLKFGVSSALFDGTGDYLIVSSNPLPSTGNFTVEFWIRPTALAGIRPVWSNRDTNGTNRGVLYLSGTGLTWWNGDTNLNHGITMSVNTWYHIACVLDGGTRRLFVNGADMVTINDGYIAGDVFQIGRADYSGTAFSSELPGYIDEFRVSNTARYTANFTPSTTPFQNDANTLLLIHADGTNASTVFLDDNGIAPYTP